MRATLKEKGGGQWSTLLVPEAKTLAAGVRTLDRTEMSERRKEGKSGRRQKLWDAEGVRNFGPQSPGALRQWGRVSWHRHNIIYKVGAWNWAMNLQRKKATAIFSISSPDYWVTHMCWAT